MALSPFQSAIEALLKPLEFAARDDFAHIERVRNLADSVAAAGARAAGLAIPPEARQLIRSVVEGVARAGEGATREVAIRHALEALRPLVDPSWAIAALARSPASLPGVGPKRADVLAKRGLATVADLLFHLPSRYDDRRSLANIADLEVGLHCTFTARVVVSDFVAQRGRGGRRRGRAFEAVVADDSGTIRLKWFHGTDAIARTARKGALLLVTGDVTRYRFDKEVVHPEIEALAEDAPGDSNDPGGAVDVSGLGQIIPDYASPEGMHPRALRRLVEKAVSEYADLVGGHLPASVVREQHLPEPAAALRELHQPSPDSDVDALRTGASPAHARLILEELYLLELGLALRHASRGREPGIAVAGGAEAARRSAAKLPFRLTGAQERVWDEICADLARPHPMSRLLEGDVGCGKTVVAFLAAVAVAKGGHQTALMAPTELLAEQHLRTLSGIAAAAGEGAGEGAGLRLALLTSSLPRARAEAVRRAIAAGEVDLAIGTHALLQASVEFRSLALVVIDEQHRFGVRQRAALAEKTPGAATPHMLVMTATPIPRTLALTVHGDLDLSVIDELPPGRSATRTLLIRPGDGRRVSDLLRQTVSRGEQVYVVYPLVEESAKIDLRSAVESAERIRAAFPEMSIDLVHGQMEGDERVAAMDRFARGETQVLVSTTVIEVGVDVPNATLMIIEHAERFGLAQLHQLRGRVGRGDREGTCVCVARAVTEDSEARLSALLATTDGFAIANADLAIRGPGEFLGTRQSGRLPDLRIADLIRDARWIPVARAVAQETVRNDPQLQRSGALAGAVRARWGDRLALAGVG